MNIKIKFTDEFEVIRENVSYYKMLDEYLEVHCNDLSIETFSNHDIEDVSIY